MSKILYIDDELDGVKIINLFGKYLTESEESELTTALQSDIPTILANNIYLQAEYDFVKVLVLLENDFEKFNFFIIDRNLKGNNEHPVYDVDAAEKMTLPNRRIEPEREGDYIFIVLLEKYCKYSNPAILFDTFFFLTANKSAELNYKELYLLQPENIVAKDRESEFANKVINKFQDLVIKSEHREVFEVFSKGYLPQSFENELINILKHNNIISLGNKANWYLLRQMFEECLKTIVDTLKSNGVDKEFTKKGGNLNSKGLFEYLNGSLSYKTDFKPITTEYCSQTHYYLSDCFWGSISEILHGGGNEYRKVKYKNSKYTEKIMLYTIMDFLLWYGDFMDKYSKPTP